jgi:hypothetical protein
MDNEEISIRSSKYGILVLTDRLERILTMVYVVQSYWAYFGLYPYKTMDKVQNKPNSSVLVLTLVSLSPLN